jgi:hypothetical protein
MLCSFEVSRNNNLALAAMHIDHNAPVSPDCCLNKNALLNAINRGFKRMMRQSM